MKIDTILFDLDDTILDFKKAERAALKKTLLELGIEPEERILQRYSEINQAQWKLLELGKLVRSEVKLRRYRLLFEEFGIKESAERAAKIYETQLGIGHYFVDGAEEMLLELSGKCRLYLVTNGTACVQKGRIASAGIGHYFQDIFISEEIGFNKPDREFFERCFAKIPDFRKENTIIVGDSLSSDILGGINAGIQTVWFNPAGTGKNAPGNGIIPDDEIHTLEELTWKVCRWQSMQ